MTRRPTLTAVASLAGGFLAAMTITFLAGRLLVPEDRWGDALASGDGPLSAAALIASVRDEPWAAVLETGDDHAIVTLGRPPSSGGWTGGLEPWQAYGVEHEGPFDLTMRFEGAGTSLNLVARDVAPDTVVSERAQVILNVPGGQYAAHAGECSIELLEVAFHSFQGRIFAVRNQIVTVPGFLAWIECVDIPSRDGTSSLSLRGALVYDPR